MTPLRGAPPMPRRRAWSPWAWRCRWRRARRACSASRPSALWPVPILALAVLFARVGAQRLAAAGVRFPASPSASGYFLAGVVVGVREPARFRRHAAGARRARDVPASAPTSRSFRRWPAGLAVRWARGVRRRAPRARARGLRAAANGCAAGSSPAFRGSRWAPRRCPRSPLAGFAPYVGSYGVSLAAAGVAALLAALAVARSGARARLALAAAARGALRGGRPRAAAAVDAARGRAGLAWRCCRATCPQHLKWREDMRARRPGGLPAHDLRGAARAWSWSRRPRCPRSSTSCPRTTSPACASTRRASGQDILLGTVERALSRRRLRLLQQRGAHRPAARRSRTASATWCRSANSSRRASSWVLAILNIPLSDFARGAAPPAAARGRGHALRRGDLLRGRLRRGGDRRRCRQAQRARQREQRRLVRRLVRRGPAPAVLADARARDRPLDGARHQHRRDRGDRRERARGLAPAAVHRAARSWPRSTPRSGATPYVRWGNAPALALAAGLGLLAVALRRTRGRAL